jgi:hypothetical protein
MHRKERPDIPVSVRRAARNVPQRRENEEFGLRRSQTWPANLHSVERPIISDTSEQHVKFAIPSSIHRSSTQHAARAFSVSEREILGPTTTPGNDSILVVEENYDHENLPCVRHPDTAPRSQEQKATDEGYVRPYAESVDSADGDASTYRSGGITKLT